MLAKDTINDEDCTVKFYVSSLAAAFVVDLKLLKPARNNCLSVLNLKLLNQTLCRNKSKLQQIEVLKNTAKMTHVINL